MSLNTELEIINHGCDFLRADLHIHSFGEEGSYDVTDSNMTPINVVDKAIEKKLHIISIADHNEINNSKTALDYSKDKNIYVIPGIEISTTQGHLLLYFETFQNLRAFYGNLSFSEDKKICHQGIVECLNFAKNFNGIGVLAHIELDSGFEKSIGRFNEQLTAIFKHPNLYALEITKKESVNAYTDNDDNKERKQQIVSRRKELDLPNDYELAKILSSDAHTLEGLGINADGNKKLTRIKVDTPSFHAFKVALISHTSRVRLEDLIPENVPHFKGIKLKGGLLDNQIVSFSKNLTCIIGGRGAGKSTLLESLRISSGNLSASKVVDSDVWSDNITLLYEDETGKQEEFGREKNGDLQNITDSANGLSKILVESYGQGETANTIQHSDSNPKILLDFLDTFLDVNGLKLEDISVCSLLTENQSELNKLRLEVQNIPETKKQKLNAERKLELLKKEKVGELVGYHSSLIKERAFRSNLINDLKNLIDNYREILNDTELFENVENLTDEDIIIGKDDFKAVKSVVNEFSKIVSQLSEKLQEELNKKIEELRKHLNDWQLKEKNIQQKIEDKKKELETKGIPFDLGKINQITKDVIFYDEKLKKLIIKEKTLKTKEVERAELIKQRKEIKNKIFYKRHEFALNLNNNLKNTIEGFFVTVKYYLGKYSPDFEDNVKSLMDFRTAQVPKSKTILEKINPFDFIEAIKKKNTILFKTIVNEDGSRILNDFEVAKIIERFNENFNYEDIESVQFEDFPEIAVTRSYKDENNNLQHFTKTIGQLSLGQQQSILLAILLHSKNNYPLIIDQPEDNLDSEFIYKSIVKNFRRIKEKRQVIIVTHNPNIAVLGDAELIIPMKSTSTKSMIIDRGSIDTPKTRDITCDILEGGKQAFIMRKEIYGIK